MENSGEEVVAGLDIGTTKICAIIGRKNSQGKIEVLGIGKAESLGVTRGVVVNIEKTVASIKQAMEEAQMKAGYDVPKVHVGIAGQHIKSLQHRGMVTRNNIETEISQKDIDTIKEDMFKLAMMPGEEIIHVIPQEFIVDSEQGIKEPIGMSGIRLEANCHIITGHVAAIKNIKKCVERANLVVDDLVLEPLASADAVLTREEREAGVALIDIGGGTTDVAIFQENVIRHTAVIPFGGNVITDDIKEGCSIIRNQAELLKIKFGSAMARENQDNEIVSIPGLRGREPREISMKNLASIIQARMEEIIEQVLFEIRSSGYEKKLIAGIVVTGGGAQLKHIKQLFEYHTGLDTRVGFPNEHISSGKVDEVKSPLFATGVGLLLKAIESQKPEDQEVRQKSGTQKRRGLFSRLLDQGKTWFEEEEDDKRLK